MTCPAINRSINDKARPMYLLQSLRTMLPGPSTEWPAPGIDREATSWDIR